MRLFKNWKRKAAIALSVMTIASLGSSVTAFAEETEVTGSETSVAVALNIYYVDKYFYNVVGAPVVITGDGQYTVTFDCATDLPDKAKDIGVTSIVNVGSIYIKDYDVTMGRASRSILKTCDIKYDSVEVDGVALTVNKADAESALNDAGILLDSGEPVNSWDGSYVDEVVTDKTAFQTSFTTVENPQVIKVTFTISNFAIDEDAVAEVYGSKEEETTKEEAKEDNKTDKEEATTEAKEADEKSGIPTIAIVGIAVVGVAVVAGVVIAVTASKKKK